MKSLLKTLPKEETIEMWGAHLRTNLEDLREYADGKKLKDKTIIGMVVEVFSGVEMRDLLVAKASATMRGRILSIQAESRKEKGRNFFRMKLKLHLSECEYCGKRIYVDRERPEYEAQYHKRKCPVVDMIQVMGG